MKVARQGLITGLLPEVVDGSIISLQYVDDTLLFLENNLEKAGTLKWLLTIFEHMSGMKIIYDKSELLTIGLDVDSTNCFARIFLKAAVLCRQTYPFESLLGKYTHLSSFNH